MILVKIIELLLYSLISIAGNEVGNGGDVIICKDSVKLLDYYEAADLGFFVSEPKDNKKYEKIIYDLLEEFQNIDDKLARQYKKRMEEISKEIEFKSSIVLTDIPDSNHEALPTGCRLEQIAIRRNEEKNGKLFLISKDLWNKMDNTNKAGLILHEIIYEHFLYLGEKDSRKARFMNALISHIGSKKNLQTNYKKILQSQKIPIYR